MDLPASAKITIEHVHDHATPERIIVLRMALGPTYGLNSQAYIGHRKAMIPAYSKADLNLLVDQVTQATVTRLAEDYFHYVEEQAMGLTPDRQKLAQWIDEAQTDMGEMTPQMLADYLLLKMSEGHQTVRPFTIKEAAQEVAPQVTGYHSQGAMMQTYGGSNPPVGHDDMQQMFKLTTNGLRLGVAAYLNHVAAKNRFDITGKS